MARHAKLNTLFVLLTEEDKKLYREYCDKNGYNMSKLIRTLLRDYMATHKGKGGKTEK